MLHIRPDVLVAQARVAELMPFHPEADILPLIKGDRFDELVGDIGRRGLRVSITTHKGQIIDGRNRYLACLKAGVEPKFVEFEGKDEEVTRFIISMNIHRRDLKPEERRELLKKLLKMNPEKSNRAIAAEIGVDEITVRRARRPTATNVAVDKRIGRDGKARKLPQRRQKPKLPPAEVIERCSEGVVLAVDMTLGTLGNDTASCRLLFESVRRRLTELEQEWLSEIAEVA
jgi:ParB-like chromosome segregation protein Spo0J